MWYCVVRVRKQLLTERSLTLDKAIQICQLNELSEDYGKQLSKREPDKQDVNCLKSKKQLRKRSPMLSSKSCGGEHRADKQACPAFGKQCHGCGKANHFKKICYSAKFRHTGPKAPQASESHRKPKVDEILTPKYSPEGSDKELYIIETIEGLHMAHNNKEIHCTTKINGQCGAEN